MILSSNGLKIQIDEEDYSRLCCISWSLNGAGYASGRAGKKVVFMHRYLVNAQLNEVVHHIDNDKLNNQKANLKIVTTIQNSWLREQINSNNTSGYRGVHWCKTRQKWLARIRVKEEKIYLGAFDDPKEASVVFERWRKYYHAV